MMFYIIFGLFSLVGANINIQLPRPSSHHPVGRVDLELIDELRMDPLAPTPQPRDLKVSVFYPTSKRAVATGKYDFAPYFPSTTTSDAFQNYIGNSTALAALSTQSYHQAPIATCSDFPVLVFSHGLGGSRVLHTAQLEDLASHGWTIVAVDHPYDALVTEYPDGRVLRMPQSDLENFPYELPDLIAIRVADVDFIVRSLGNSSSTLSSQIPGLPSGRILNSSPVGIFGHSLGGATAAQTVANHSSTFPCGANFDGGIFGPVATTGLDGPFLQISGWDHAQSTDKTFFEFWDQLRGFRREFVVNRTVHISFMDIPILKDLLGEQFSADLRNESGTSPGEAVLGIETALIDAFFGFCLRGKSSNVLDRLARDGWFPDLFEART